MKEEVLFQPEGSIITGEWTVVDRGYGNNSQSTCTPKPRFKHQIFEYKEKIYVHGGTTIPSTNMSDNPIDLYCFDPSKAEGQKWQKLLIRCNNKEFQAISGHSGVVNGNKWFMYGGSNANNRTFQFLWRLNLDNLQMVKLQQRGQLPGARDSASLFFIQKNWLVLYGGISLQDIQIFNTFHFYNLDTKNWSRCEGSYIHQAYARLDPALVMHGEKIYLFGGTYRNACNQEKYLNDMYEITLNTPSRNLTGRVQMSRLIALQMPECRSGHTLVSCGNSYLLLIGGQNSTLQQQNGVRTDDVNLVNNTWIYNISKNVWNKIEFEDQGFKYRTMSNCTVIRQKLYLFGGLAHYALILGDMLEIKINTNKFQKQMSNNSCVKCQQKMTYNFQPHYYSSDLIEDIVANIQFPFAAIALLTDNALTAGASIFNILFSQMFGSLKIKVLRFEDNALLNWSEQQFIESMSSFQSGFTSLPQGLDKKSKNSLMRQSWKREFGSNIKLASLRLGSSFLYISCSENKQFVKICLFQCEERNTNKERFVLHYYSYSTVTNELTSQYMDQARTKIQAKYKDYIKEAINKKEILNLLLVFDPIVADYRSQDQQCELKSHVPHNDIIFGSITTFQAMEKAGFNAMDCVDISLRAYITCLYLKNEVMKISLSVKSGDQGLNSIPTQIYLQKVDRLCKHKHVLQINSVLQFQFKIMELYYVYDLKRKLNYFSNGLLIYHKNRLITRYKYKLGDLLYRKSYKIEGHFNFLRMFGFIELPQHIPVNMFKTNFLFHLMMEKLFIRLKIINKMFKKGLVNIAKKDGPKRMFPTLLNQQEAQKDRSENYQIKTELKQKRTYNKTGSARRTMTTREEAREAVDIEIEGLQKNKIKQIQVQQKKIQTKQSAILQYLGQVRKNIKKGKLKDININSDSQSENIANEKMNNAIQKSSLLPNDNEQVNNEKQNQQMKERIQQSQDEVMEQQQRQVIDQDIMQQEILIRQEEIESKRLMAEHQDLMNNKSELQNEESVQDKSEGKNEEDQEIQEKKKPQDFVLKEAEAVDYRSFCVEQGAKNCPPYDQQNFS